MNGYDFTLAGAALTARASGALWWPAEGLLAVSDLHLGKSERLARRGGALLPPYEVRETLARLAAEIAATEPRTVLCLGDSFDDVAAADGLDPADRAALSRLMAGRRWIWAEGNHDPGPVELGGTHLAEFRLRALSFRHIATPGARGEVSGHYHPKARLSLRGQAISRPCFLIDADRVILPAFGAYTGGLRSDDPVLEGLMGPQAVAVLTGPAARAIPMPRRR
ncbi:ligase-associated DNA damage response endonuclease PdeM [Actibacterium sp. MT2.3-13A]|uniref:ligase-associated DNA damage response endonuclease PdeM n=1 Tax=Actibacterium sp. MT2.3-13A TaxID=2828332 RepID=UPI001BA884B8|nr:ligase-associated DNA damage response endonuclease PdeM [Actibacterium sp. MT2.3-13A]